jgi:hypothetical protein
MSENGVKFSSVEGNAIACAIWLSKCPGHPECGKEYPFGESPVVRSGEIFRCLKCGGHWRLEPNGTWTKL